MSEIAALYDSSWESAQAANRAYDAMNVARSESNRQARAVEFDTLVEMASPAMIMPGSPYLSPRYNDVDGTQIERYPIEQQLNRPVKDILPEIGLGSPVQLKRTQNCLERSGITTLRGVLAIGRQAIGGMRNAGPVTVGYLEKIIATVDPKAEWLDKPEIDDVAEICWRLDQVPAFILDKVGSRTLANVEAVNDLSLSDLTEILEDRQRYVAGIPREKIPAIAWDIKAKAEKFAKDFATARTEM